MAGHSIPIEFNMYTNTALHGGIWALKLIDLYQNRVNFSNSTKNYLFVYIGVYMLVNLLFTILVEPVYPILLWNSFKDIILVSVAVGISLFSFNMGKKLKDKHNNNKKAKQSRDWLMCLKFIVLQNNTYESKTIYKKIYTFFEF